MWVQKISVLTHEAFVAEYGEDKKNLRGRFVVLVAVDKDGELAFTDEDAAALGEEPQSVIDRIFEAGRKLNGLGDDSEQAAKNSEKAPGESSNSS